MTLIAGVKGDEFYITMNCGAQAEAKKLGVTPGLPGPGRVRRRPSRRRSSTRSRRRSRTRCSIAPTDTKALFAPIKQLADAGSKVVLVDTTLDQPDMAVSQISSDNEGGGKHGGRRRWPS